MLTKLPQYVAYIRKAIIQFLTLVVTLATAVATYTNLPDKYAGLITAVVGVAGSVLHYGTPNADLPTDNPLPEVSVPPEIVGSAMDPRLIKPTNT